MTRKVSATDRGAFMRRLDEDLKRDPALHQRVETMLNEIRLEQRLAELRERSGLTQVQLAKRIGVTQPAIARIESGKVRNMQLKTLLVFLAAMGARMTVDFTRPRRLAGAK
ncbi:MAG: XRE family transcriptional regulator [Candidatus Rokubacteria bacterium]|nr:XRE family transcriptional regulator [Candidatus Rokubacteria bacterium]